MSKININIDKAKEIKKQRVRKERESLFPKLDVLWMLAIERSDSEKAAEIAEMKQKLRDATKSPEILESETVEDLISADPLKEIKEYLNG